jgi:hypothetical protein
MKEVQLLFNTRELTQDERVQQAERLLADYKDAVKSAPEMAQALMHAFFDSHAQIGYGQRSVRFLRGGFEWEYQYVPAFHTYEEGSRLIKRVSNKPGSDEEGIVINVSTRDQGVKDATIGYYEWKEHSGRAPPELLVRKINTTQALRKVERVLADFRTAAAPEP